VVAVVLVATALSGGFIGGFGVALGSVQPAESQIASLKAAPTAIAVGVGEVRWFGTRDDGAFAYNVANIDSVCPLDRQPDCAPIADGHARRVSLMATPKFVFQSPVDQQAVVVGTDAAGADAVIVVALPTPAPAAPLPSSMPLLDTPAPSVTVPTAEPIVTPAPTSSESPSAIETPTFEASAPDTGSPAPTLGPAVAILTNVTIVGRGAGYSADGAWFAFSARPADGSAGPDIYAWHVGDPQAMPLTADHASVFASWVGNELLGSRITPGLTLSAEANPSGEPGATPELTPSPDGSAPTLEPGTLPEPTPAPEFATQTVLIDPATGLETPMLGADWQPVVDPTGVWVAAWEGTVRAGPDGVSMVPGTGRLVAHAFQALSDLSASPGPGDQPTLPADQTPVPTELPSATLESNLPSDQSPEPGEPAIPIGPQVLAEGPISEFDVRWDDTGTWLAVWLADAVDPTIGRLSLLHVDPATGIVTRPAGAPQDVPALPGFSIREGRLAWATPPGQGGEGSRIQVVAWTADEVGAVESVPVEGAIVIQ
jgi:hypothetical protein